MIHTNNYVSDLHRAIGFDFMWKMKHFVRIPLTRYGLPQVVLLPIILLAGMMIYFLIVDHFFQPVCACPIGSLLVWLPELILLTLLIWVFSFFRNPHRQIVQDTK